MRKKQLLFLLVFLVSTTLLFAQTITVRGTVKGVDGLGLPGVSIIEKGTSNGTSTDFDGNYQINVAKGKTLVFSSVGLKTIEEIVSSEILNITLKEDANQLDEVVITAMGMKQEKKALPFAVAEVKGVTVAETQRENFVNSLAGRVSGVQINSTSGLPGASTSIVIRGASSLSGSNQPLFVVDGLPISNGTISTSQFANSGGSNNFSNRGIDFTNRAADINPEDIESITILKGPEASALYGIEAASGAVVITTKRGKEGKSRIDYSNSFRFSKIVEYPEIQKKYGRGKNGYTVDGDESLYFFGHPYEPNTKFYDNVGNFFQNAYSSKHNISFSGGSEKMQYRIASSQSNSKGFVPTTKLDKFNLTSAITADFNKYLSGDVTFDYTRSDNNQTFRGTGGPLLHLLLWPSTDDASNYLTPAGKRRNYADFADGVENAFFNVNSNILNSLTDRYKLNAKLTASPFEWLKLVGQVGVDYYTTKSTIVRHPESNLGKSYNGIFDQSIATTRNRVYQGYAQFTPKKLLNDKLSANLKIGTAIYDYNRFSAASTGLDFQAPNLFSINNTKLETQRSNNRLTQRRLVGLFSSLNLSYDNMLFLTLTGRNDWSSTLPKKNNSFFYPSAGFSFVFTELEGVKGVLSFGKLRASIAQVGKDASPYSIRPFYTNASTTGGGYRYGFTAPNLNLRPEMTTSYEFGTELKFLKNRVGFNATYFHKKSIDQIVRNLRLSYATGFVLLTFNAGEIENKGVEFDLNINPIKTEDFNWDIDVNYSKNWSKLVSLPGNVSEFYNSDTWLYGNVRSGARVGGPLSTLTGLDYQRNDKGDVLINASNGLPILNTKEWVVVGDRNPDFSMGISNNFTYKNFGLNFLLDIRVGGDVYNATEHYLTTRGLSKRTLNREVPRIVEGVLKDGYENTANPTVNNIPIDLYRNSSYWSRIYPHKNFIEKDVNWFRLRDITLNYNLPNELLQKTKSINNANVFITATNLFLFTNYSGLDPVANGNSAAVGSAGVGFDYGNFPLPRSINIGFRVGF